PPRHGQAAIGAPSPPSARCVEISVRERPPRKCQRLVRFAGAIGWPHSSLSSGRAGPSPRPSVPWHLWHSIASNISLPRLIEASEDATSFGSSSFFGASLKALGANVLRYATRW